MSRHLCVTAVLMSLIGPWVGESRHAQASVQTFYGLDLSAGPGGAHPNSDAAHTSFLAQLGTVGVETFEGDAIGQFPASSRPAFHRRLSQERSAT